MTKDEQNRIIKEAWVRNLRKEKDIPSNIGELYANWVRNIVSQASTEMKGPPAPQEGQQPPQGQEPAPEGEAGGEAA